MGANRESVPQKAQEQTKATEQTGPGAAAAAPKAAWQGYVRSLSGKADGEASVQMDGGDGAGDPEAVKAAADAGVQGGGGSLPHLETIQQSFGRHDVSGVEAHVGGAAREASESIGAKAYAYGDQVAFAESPDLHTAAHEAAHVVQQRGGVQLKGGVGQAGDEYERHADAVADAVVRGESAEALLDPYAGTGDRDGGVQGRWVQLLGHDLDKELPEDAETPGHGSYNPRTGQAEDKDYRGATKQRRYTVEQYIEMWEAERGRKMTEHEKKTLARGCIGIVALNIEAVNPPLDHAYASFDKAMEVVNEWNAFIEKNKGKEMADGTKVGDYKAVLFAKLFWSNQRDYDPSLSAEENKKLSNQPDEDAFQPDPKTGKVDMSGYKYRGRPGYINFDYGFWDEDSNCFWHANHAEPGMKVYQSTKEKFSAGYIDFDRIIYCAAICKKYDPKGAARTHG